MQQFLVMTDSLKEGEDTALDETLDPSILDLAEDDEIKVTSPVLVKGRVYRSSEWVIVDASVSVLVELPCAMCNEPFTRKIDLKRWVHEQEAPKDGVLNLGETLREAILLEVPFFALCNGESCRNITEIEKFIRKECPHEGHKPFLEALG